MQNRILCGEWIWPSECHDNYKIDCLPQQTIKNWILLSQKISCLHIYRHSFFDRQRISDYRLLLDFSLDYNKWPNQFTFLGLNLHSQTAVVVIITVIIGHLPNHCSSTTAWHYVFKLIQTVYILTLSLFGYIQVCFLQHTAQLLYTLKDLLAKIIACIKTWVLAYFKIQKFSSS